MNPRDTRTVFLGAPGNGDPCLRRIRKPASTAFLERKTACHLPRQAPQFAPWPQTVALRRDPPA